MNLNERIAYLKKLAPEQCYRAEYEQNAYIEIRYLAEKDLFEVRIERPDYMDKPQTEVSEYTGEKLLLVGCYSENSAVNPENSDSDKQPFLLYPKWASP